MGRSRRNREFDRIEAGIKLAIGLIMLAALSLGGLENFSQNFHALIQLVILAGVMIAATLGIIYMIRKSHWSFPRLAPSPIAAPRTSIPASTTNQRVTGPVDKEYTTTWNTSSILKQMQRIDWYQFEKLCAAILQAEGYSVNRKGGAQPDGGVDLVACKFDGNDILIQCKHWNSWKVGEPVVRQMLGSMTDFGVRSGAIYTIKGWTQPAQHFAKKHQIQMVAGEELALRAYQTLSPTQLDVVLDDSVHHCPKCESNMVLRTGDFKPFWGCSRFPRCRGKIKIAEHNS